jgi:hypothetical protein
MRLLEIRRCISASLVLIEHQFRFGNAIHVQCLSPDGSRIRRQRVTQAGRVELWHISCVRSL